MRAFAWSEMPEAKTECQDPFFRLFETTFRSELFQATMGDDFIFEPWVAVRAACVTPPGGIWGLPTRWIHSDDPTGANRMDPVIREPDDAKRMVQPHHLIDEAETRRRHERLLDAIGDIIDVVVDRAPVYRAWNADMSTNLAQLRGLDQIMYDMMDRPEWLHDVLAFMRDGILRTHEEAEQAGDWRLCAHENQGMPYARDLEAPSASTESVTRDRLWCFCAAQEFTLVGPAMFDEFMLQYQRTIFEKFALVSYGCCEDLSHKIDLLKRIPNLRRIAVAPVADVPACAEQIGADYVLSYRPSPTDMVGYGFDPERIRRIMRADLAACKEWGCHVDITLKDVETVQHDPTRLRRWVELARGEIDRVESSP